MQQEWRAVLRIECCPYMCGKPNYIGGLSEDDVPDCLGLRAPFVIHLCSRCLLKALLAFDKHTAIDRCIGLLGWASKDASVIGGR